MIDKNTNLLVVSAHAADFVWRAGGTIAKYIKYGANVKLIVLSYGARGESNNLWNTEGQTLENVKKIRQSEIDAAAACLGVKDIEVWDFEDYHMEITPERMERMVKAIRAFKPYHILTHGPHDAFNPDHETVYKYVFDASVMSTSNGIRLEGYTTAKQARIFGFEPHQTEISNFEPEVILDITETYEQKEAAMNCYKAQKHLIEYYAARAMTRGNHARRISGNKDYKYAETFTRVFPYVGGEFI